MKIYKVIFKAKDHWRRKCNPPVEILLKVESGLPLGVLALKVLKDVEPEYEHYRIDKVETTTVHFF